jgi:ribosome-associated heat shock protein Hsp15
MNLIKEMSKEVRIDKWLWAARIFKTRSIATEECKKGRISIGNISLKPSRTIKEGDIINVKKPPIIWSFKVLKAIENRVGAKLIPEVLENVTSPEQLQILELSKTSGFIGREKGTGRPTKKDRRELDDFIDESVFMGFEFDED